jgi:hypothetical protein
LAFVILVVPLQFGKAWLTLGWLAEGVLLTSYGILKSEKTFKKVGFVINALCLLSFLIIDLWIGTSPLFAYKYLAITLGSLMIIGAIFLYLYQVGVRVRFGAGVGGPGGMVAGEDMGGGFGGEDDEEAAILQQVEEAIAREQDEELDRAEQQQQQQQQQQQAGQAAAGQPQPPAQQPEVIDFGADAAGAVHAGDQPPAQPQQQQPAAQPAPRRSFLFFVEQFVLGFFFSLVPSWRPPRLRDAQPQPHVD